MMKDYQLHVINEKEELDKKAKALSQFIGLSAIFETLDIDDAERPNSRAAIAVPCNAGLTGGKDTK